VADQTLADHEVIIVDDGSMDGAPQEAEADARAGRAVRLLHSAGHGAVAARRIGVAAAQAPILAFTDSDCVPEPGWLAAGVAAVEGGFDLAQGATYPTRTPVWPERSMYVVAEDGLYATCNIFYRRDAFEAAGGFDPAAGERLGFRHGSLLRGTGFGEDTLLGWRVRRAGRTAFVPEAVVRHHVFDTNLSESFRRAWIAGAFPALVREVPELRQTLLRRTYFLGERSRLPLYVAAAAALAGHRRIAIAGVGGWALARARTVFRREPTWRRRAKVLPADLALDAVMAVALATGTLRATTPVL
jgi:glycosyltransferase involved in cell wall biosynthesis